MLKAQMLATALDVYFKRSGSRRKQAERRRADWRGHDRPEARLRGHSNLFELRRVSSAFGGASSMTVSQMLAYAGSQSNVGGSTWYGNIKATQVLAKDAFDAINNQVAFTL